MATCFNVLRLLCIPPLCHSLLIQEDPKGRESAHGAKQDTPWGDVTVAMNGTEAISSDPWHGFKLLPGPPPELVPGGTVLRMWPPPERCRDIKGYDKNALVLAVMVPTPQFAFGLRRLVRDTWMVDAQGLQYREAYCGHSPAPDHRRVCVDVKFFAGLYSGESDDEEKWSTLAEEMHSLKDLVILPVPDNQWLQFVKTASLFSWALHHRPYADFVLKVDSDTYFYAPRFVQVLPPPSSNPVLLGRKFHFRMRDYDTGHCPRGELYGVSQTLLRWVADGDSDFLSYRAVKDSKWNNSLVSNIDEDISACAILDRTLASHADALKDSPFSSILLKPKDYQRMWIHPVKKPEEFRKCHKVGAYCRAYYLGKWVQFSYPASLPGASC